MSAAFEVAFAEPDRLQPGTHRLDMALLAIVRGAGERDVLVAQAEAFDGAALDEGHRLDRLVGRAWQDRRIDVAPRRDDRAVRLDDRGGTLVPALDQRPARDLDDNCIAAAHSSRSSLMTVTLS